VADDIVLVSLRGPVRWAWRDEARASAAGQIDKATLQDGKRIVIRLTHANDAYSVDLQREFGDKFSGTWNRYLTGESNRASVTLYQSLGNYFLFGEWFQDGEQFWWAELSVVPDEE